MDRASRHPGSRRQHTLPLRVGAPSPPRAPSASSEALGPSATRQRPPADREALAQLFHLAEPRPDPAYISDASKAPLGPPIEDRLPPRARSPGPADPSSRLPALVLGGIVLVLLAATLYVRDIRSGLAGGALGHPGSEPAGVSATTPAAAAPAPPGTLALTPVPARSTPGPAAEPVLPELQASLDRLASHASWFERASAARSLGEGADRSRAARSALLESLRGDPAWEVRACAADALGRLGLDAEARAALEQARRDDAERGVREAASLALEEAPPAE